MNRFIYAARMVKIAQHTIYPTIAFALSADTSAMIPKPMAPSIRLSRKVNRKNFPLAFICPLVFMVLGVSPFLYLCNVFFIISLFSVFCNSVFLGGREIYKLCNFDGWGLEIMY